MNKHRAQHRTKGQDNLPKVTWECKHLGYCGGFSIHVLPKRKGDNRFLIMKGGDYFGIDLSLPEARATINRLVNNNCFIIN